MFEVGQTLVASSVIVVGAGLSGLVAARRLVDAGIGCSLIEARNRAGGRILSINSSELPTDNSVIPAIDLGPSWFWPGQHRISALIEELELDHLVFEQQSAGVSLMEYANGPVQKGAGVSMAGSLRLSGGLHQLTEKLAEQLPRDMLMTDTRLTKLVQAEKGVQLEIQHKGKPSKIQAQHVILALPPRVAAATLSFDPPVDHKTTSGMLEVPTWMAGQAKFIALYAEPFWRQQGLSGDAISQQGPLVEIHDASPAQGGPYALFGFVGVAASARKDREPDVKEAALQQLIRMFGPMASSPIALHYKDWAFDPLTAMDRDHAAAREHPGGPSALTVIDGYNVHWAGTETAQSGGHSSGYLEGAVESGERSATTIAAVLSA